MCNFQINIGISDFASFLCVANEFTADIMLYYFYHKKSNDLLSRFQANWDGGDILRVR